MDTCIELQNAVESFSDGKKESFNQIYDLSYRYLHTCVIHVVKDEDIAMDVLQETYLEISKSIVQLKNKEGFLNWTATIANRKSYAYLRKRKDTLLFADNEEDESDDFFENIADNEEFIPETVLQNREKQRLIKEIIDDLTDIQRFCVIGYYFNEQKQDEIAEELSIPVNTVKSHLNRAKAKIKEAVVDLDEKKGTRLYSMAPFMLLFFKEEVKACVLKPMAATVALEVGAKATSGNLSGLIKDVIAKAKSLWTKSATAVKVKVAAGATVGAVTVGGVAAGLSGLSGQPEGEKISLEFKNFLDQIIEICEEGNYEQLSDLDDEWAALWEQWEDNDAESIRFYQTGAPFDKFYNENQEIINNCFYNGKDAFLQKNYTGYGVGINNNELALGYFKDGKAEGELTTLLISDMSITYSDGDCEMYTLYDVTKMNIEDGSIIGNVEMTSYYDYQKSDRFEGSVSLVGYYDTPRRWEGYAFTDKVTWTMYDYYNSNRPDGLPIEVDRVFYMNEQGMIDKNRHVIENDTIIDVKSGYPIYLIGDRPQGSMFDNIFVSMVYFDVGNEMKQGYNMPVKETVTPVTERVETTETNIEADSEATTETIAETDSEATTDSNLTIVFNGDSYSAEEKEYEEIYITYEDMEPTKMYATRYTEVYPDLNASEGVLRMDGCLFEGDEITINGKGTFDGVEYYRIKRPDNCFNPYHSIVLANALSLEKNN